MEGLKKKKKVGEFELAANVFSFASPSANSCGFSIKLKPETREATLEERAGIQILTKFYN